MSIMNSGSTDGMTQCISHWNSIPFVVAVSTVLVKNCAFLSDMDKLFEY